MKEMQQTVNEFESVLKEEDAILDKIISCQNELRHSVIDKNWENLMKNIDTLNALSDEFQKVDECRDILQDNLYTDEIRPYFELMSTLRSKLLRCKIENQSINKYVNVSKEFIQEVIEKAVPHGRNKVYTKTGIVQPQPQSLVLNKLF